MKSLRISFRSLALGVFSTLTLLSMSSAFAGVGAGGGGDICEDRFKIVRDDIASWIRKGGPTGLKLSEGMDAFQYSTSMLGVISKAKVSCTDEVIRVGNAEKTCKGTLEGDTPRVVCNSKRFVDTDQSSQYVLVHHEYAGLSGVEINQGEDSDYNVSNQISGYLVDEVVKKLAIAPQAPALCSSLDRKKTTPVGTKCTTSKEAVFERVNQDRFGEAWKGPDGLIWSEERDEPNYQGAVEICADLNARLPSKSDIVRAEGFGFREVIRTIIPHLESQAPYSDDQHDTWTSTRAIVGHIIFQARHGNLYTKQDGNGASAYCVTQ